jgi:ketosteroid isomerase-like protein
MASNVEIVHAVSDAIKEGDALRVMGLVAKDVCWTAHAAVAGSVPWLGVYRGKRGLLDLFAAFATTEFTELGRKATVAEGDLVVTWAQLAFVGPTDRPAETDEVAIWRLADGKVQSVDVFLDTAAVADAFR